MDPLTLLLVTLLIIFLSYFFNSPKKRRIAKYVNKFPGPKAWPIIGNVLDFTAPRNKRFKQIDQIVQKYGPICRLWLLAEPSVHIIRPEHAEIVLKSSEHIDKSWGYIFLYPWLGTGLLTSTGSKWRSHRKMITPAFHFTILNVFFEVMSEKANTLVQKLKHHCDEKAFDIYPHINLCALDIICETAMGVSMNTQQDEEMKYVEAIKDISEAINARALSPWIWPDIIFKRTNKGKKFFRDLETLHGFTRKVIQDRKQLSEIRTVDSPREEDGVKKQQAFLDLLLQASNNGESLTDEEIREEVDTFMFEGHDTTTVSINWILYLLGLHPEYQNKVAEELNAIFDDTDRPVTLHDLNEMKYLEQVIKEGLRIFPSVPVIGRELKKDLIIDNQLVPSGTSLLIHIYRIHRCPDQFPDPEKFNPDNFLPENCTKRHPNAFVPFSAGPRNCIGQKFALLEEKTILSQILRYYEIKSEEKLEDINLLSELVLRPENGIILSIRPRKLQI